MKATHFYDLETTWDNTNQDDQIVQAAYTLKDYKLMEETHDTIVAKFWVTKPISIQAMATHHIREQDVEWMETFESSIHSEVLQGFAKTGILVAHNAQFDNGVLNNYGIQVTDYICTLKLAKRILYGKEDVESFSLQYLRYYLGIDDTKVRGKWMQAHDAGVDVYLTVKLFERLIQMMITEKKLGSEKLAMQKALEISKQPSLVYKLRFGKYRGKTYQEVASTQQGKQYFDRCLKNMDRIDPDDEYTMRYHLGSLL